MAATDDFGTQASGTSSPARHVILITPHDTDELSHVTRGISFSVAGALVVVTQGGETVTIPSGSLAAGIIHPLAVKIVKSTGNGCSNIVGYY